MFIMPSHYDSFGLVALEAMSMGRPVIASEVGGLAFLVRDGETGFHIPSRDPEALADKMYRLLSDAAFRDSLGRKAQAYAQQFGWPVVVERILHLYEEVLQDVRQEGLGCPAY
jgi:D-inositol-3-phosphate glycosyltransferase